MNNVYSEWQKIVDKFIEEIWNMKSDEYAIIIDYIKYIQDLPSESIYNDKIIKIKLFIKIQKIKIYEIYIKDIIYII